MLLYSIPESELGVCQTAHCSWMVSQGMPVLLREQRPRDVSTRQQVSQDGDTQQAVDRNFCFFYLGADDEICIRMHIPYPNQ